MNILVYSDLHLEFSDFSVCSSGYDVVILAGDIHLGEKGARWAKKVFADVPVIYICGNHEYYHGDLNEVQHAIRAETANSNIRYCENETVQIGDVRFVCATLWSDFQITGDGVFGKLLASRGMNDYRVIEFENRLLDPEDTEKFHFESRRYLESELSNGASSDVKTVVVTHHAPSQNSLRYERVDQAYSPCYASALDDLVIRSGALLWVHGHTHESVDYWLEGTRVLSNPRGYSRLADGYGNPNFKADCIISI